MRFLAFGIALVLLTAAGLKFYGASEVSPVASSLLGDGRIRFAVILWETTLGLWLLLNSRSAVAWLAALVTFIGFAIVSMMLGITGVPSCGCLGAVKANPWGIFVGDLVVVALLLARRPERKRVVSELRISVWPKVIATGLLVSCGLLIGTHYWKGLRAIEAQVRDDAFTVHPKTIDFGRGKAGEVLESEVEISNWSEEPLEIFGGSEGCGYQILQSCPVTIPTRESTKLRLQYTLGKSPGRSSQKAMFWATYQDNERILIPITLEGTTVADGDGD